jgi:hypothetical protein
VVFSYTILDTLSTRISLFVNDTHALETHTLSPELVYILCGDFLRFGQRTFCHLLLITKKERMLRAASGHRFKNCSQTCFQNILPKYANSRYKCSALAPLEHEEKRFIHLTRDRNFWRQTLSSLYTQLNELQGKKQNLKPTRLMRQPQHGSHP